MSDKYFENLFLKPEVKNDIQDISSQLSVYEANDLVGKGNVIDQPGTIPAPRDDLRSIVDANEWLPFAAEVYDISPNIKDYIVVPVEIIVSDMPNRNGIAFPGEELLRFLPDVGQLSFRTWIGKPTCLEHKNDIANGDPAKGVILSTALRTLKQSTAPFLRLMHLMAFDRNKDSWLAGEILSRKRTGYSMGSSSRTYTCSVCGEDMRRYGKCDHIDVSSPTAKYNSLKVFGSKLAFPQSRYTIGAEVSSVSNPALISAKTSKILVE